MTARVAVPILALLALSLPLEAQTDPPAVPPAPQPTLTLQLTPEEVVNGFQAQLAITLEPGTGLEGASLEIQPPPGFRVEPGTIPVPDFSRKVTLAARVVATPEARRSGENLMIVVLRAAPVAGREPRRITSASLKFKYAPEISASRFLLLGSLGILIGYGLKILLEVLKNVPRPAPSPEPDAAGAVEGPITRFVKQNFFLVDLLVAFGLGFLALVALTRDGRPPETGTYWYTALAAGVSLGLLTNSELLTRKGGRS